jgi:predicted ATPase
LSTAKYEDRTIFSPLIARDRELEILERQVVKAITGEGSIVHLVGEAGIGKSRLIAELKAKYCIQRVILLEGRAQSFGKNLPYYPIIEFLKNWTGCREEDGDAESLRKLAAALDSMEVDGSSEFLPFIATLMGIKLWRS